MNTASSPPEQPLRQSLTAITLDGAAVGLLYAALP
jgi:hypothetical protein